MILAILLFLSVLHVSQASITVYSQVPLGKGTGTAQSAAANYTGAAAYDPTVLNAPPIPASALPSQADHCPSPMRLPKSYAVA